MKRTRAAEILEHQKITYELREFDAIDFTAEEAAVKLKIPLEMVYKTLVLRGEKSGVVLAVVPATSELSLKKLASALGEKRVEMVKIEELQKLTGYLKGGCSPLGGKKEYPVVIDSSAELQERISISAGLRGLQILIAPADLTRAARARLVEIV